MITNYVNINLTLRLLENCDSITIIYCEFAMLIVKN